MLMSEADRLARLRAFYKYDEDYHTGQEERDAFNLLSAYEREVMLG